MEIDIGNHHRNVAISIISGDEWQKIADNEIFEIQKKNRRFVK